MQTFQQRVLAMTKQIPKGKVTTYKILAEKLNTKAYRAIGQALKHNKFAAWGRVGGRYCQRQHNVIPCHRIINSNGCLGGYNGSSKINLKKKIQLLKKEGIEIHKNKIDLKKYNYSFSDI